MTYADLVAFCTSLKERTPEELTRLRGMEEYRITCGQYEVLAGTAYLALVNAEIEVRLIGSRPTIEVATWKASS